MAMSEAKIGDGYTLPCKTYMGRYFGDGEATRKYLFPIDTEESNRTDIWHKLFLVAQDEMQYLEYALPRNRSHNVLDLGTGTGIWAFSIVNYYPNAEVVAVDFNGHQPPTIPRRVSIVRSDIEDPSWSLPRDFSLAHLRLLYGSIQTDLWPAVYRNVYKHLMPETGWIEHSEMDFTPKWEGTELPDPSHYQHWSELFLRALDKKGRSARIDSARTKRQLEEAGFVDIKEDTIKCCINPWMQGHKDHELGRWTNLVLTTGFHAMSIKTMCGDGGDDTIQRDDMLALCAKANTEVCVLRYRAYLTIHTWRGRKPKRE